MVIEDSVSSQEEARRVLDREVRSLAESVGAHVVGGYLDVPHERLVRMSVVRGVPTRLARPWSRVARSAQVPVAEAVRTGRPVWVRDLRELTRRFPRTALTFPYPVAMYVAPFMDDGVCWGAVLLLWPDTRPPVMSGAEEREIDDACGRVARALRRATEAGEPLLPRPTPLALELPSQGGGLVDQMVDRLPCGVCALDMEGRLTFLNDKAREFLGLDPDEFLHRNPFTVVPWLQDPAFENAYLSALFSRLPSAFTVLSPKGLRLTITLHADDLGITVLVLPDGLPAEEADITHIASAITAMRAGTLFHLLHLASALTEAKTVKDVTDSVSDQMMPVLGAQGFAMLVAQDGRLHVVSSEGFPRSMPEYFDGLPLSARTEGVRTIERGVPSFHSDSAELLRTYPGVEVYGDMAAFAYLPLTVSGRTFGCCVLGYDLRRPFAPDEQAELTSLAGMIAQALERARLYDVNTQAARGLQAGLLPSGLPRMAGLQTAARYRPATNGLDVGGDFFDLIRLDRHTAAAVVGDVQGHSVQAAALMGQVRTAVHTHAQVGASPADVLARANRFLGDLDTELLVSCVYAQIDLRTRRAFMANAGHPPAIVRRPDSAIEVLDLPPGLLLGVEPDTTFQTTEVGLPPGSLLSLYTDGLIERPGIDIGESVDDLADYIAKAPAGPLAALCDGLIHRAEETVTEGNNDDIALLLLETDDLPQG